MADKLKYIPNDDTKNYPFRILKLVVEIFRHQPIKIQLKLLSQQIRKSYYKTLGANVINILMSPSSLLRNKFAQISLLAVLSFPQTVQNSQISADIKMKNQRFKPVLSAQTNKTVFFLNFNIRGKLCVIRCYT